MTFTLQGRVFSSSPGAQRIFIYHISSYNHLLVSMGSASRHPNYRLKILGKKIPECSKKRNPSSLCILQHMQWGPMNMAFNLEMTSSIQEHVPWVYANTTSFYTCYLKIWEPGYLQGGPGTNVLGYQGMTWL